MSSEPSAWRFALASWLCAMLPGIALQAHERPGAGGPLDVVPEGGFPSRGIAVLSWLPMHELRPGLEEASNCWGYTSPSGREYAILGVSTGHVFVEVTDPGAPRVLAHVPRTIGTNRDMKTYKDVAFLVGDDGEEAEGLQPVDLSRIDQGEITLLPEWREEPRSTHTIAVDEASGFLFRSSGKGSFGLRVYDVQDPRNPRLAGTWGTRYVHEMQAVTYTEGLYAGRQIVFCFTLGPGGAGGGFDPGIDILDITDKDQIRHLSFFVYPNAVISHQGWLSADRRHLYVNDEGDEAELKQPTTTHVIDVTDLERPRAVATFGTGTLATDHNLYVAGDLIFEGNYRSGLRVFRALDPLAPEEIAFFDTYPEDDGPELNGLWGNYPFFRSGTIVGGDIERGLFVWRLGEPDVTIQYPDGLPSAIGAEGGRLRVAVRTRAPETTVRGVVLHAETRIAASSIPFVTLGEGLWEVVIPPDPCGREVRFHVAATTEAGVTWNDPPAAPGMRHHADSPPEGLPPPPSECEPRFRRGDVDIDPVGFPSMQITDGIIVLHFLFSGGRTPPCMDSADANDSGTVDLSDAITILLYLFGGGPPPAAPGPSECGVDPTPDGLGCEAYSGC